ncbi:DUF3515 domain-containing protein [Streptomyces sp. NPDC058001]|uniref:DUF3515 domain-containing protein n=1 Tax=Streptomyces sp. NPDC058001 TaxID=3346300 RepID=UPI0036E4B262
MSFFRRRPVTSLVGPSALALLLITVAGCSSTDGPATAAVPSPDGKVTQLCRNLHKELPKRIDGLARKDPAPTSELTAGWGDPAIILRCGIPKPAKMSDPEADGITADDVGWLLERQDDGSFLFTTTLRRAYVQVSLPKSRTDGGLSPLIDLAAPIKKAIPEGIAD